MNKILSIALMAAAFASCQNSTDSDTTDSVSVDSVMMSAPAANTGDLSGMANSSAAPAAQGGAATGALNPEHGKPGHRCDIAVGAPLNGPAGQPMNSTIPPALEGAAPGMTMSAPVAAPTTGAAAKGQRLNPEHGAPGHDCAVPVGQPLKG